MTKNKGHIHITNAYKTALKAIERIPQKIITIFAGKDVVHSLKTYHLAYLNESPYMFSAEDDHVWQVLEALEAVLTNNYILFTKNSKEDMLNEDIFSKFVSLAIKLKEDAAFVKQIWLTVFLHDIAKYSVRNADHAQISGSLVKDLFKKNKFGLTAQEQARIAWVIANHDLVGNIVSSAERAPRCLIEHLKKIPDNEKQIRLDMLILLSFCDLRGTFNAKFMNDNNAILRFKAADPDWLEKKETDLFGWRKDRFVGTSTQHDIDTRRKQKLWDETFHELKEETKSILGKQFGHNIKVFTNLFYLALGLNGEELVKLLVVISLIVELVTAGKPNPDYQVDFTQGAERDGSGPVINGFKALLEKIKLEDLTLTEIQKNFNDQTIYGIAIPVFNKNKLVIDSKKIIDE